MSDTDPVTLPIVYEFPLNERVRTFLRLDFLAQQFSYFSSGASLWDIRSAVTLLLDSAVLVDRSDLRSEMLKELERQVSILSPLEKVVGVDLQRLQETLDELDLAMDRIKSYSGPFAHGLRNNELLLSVQNRSAIPGGTCSFDLPAYHAWLERGIELCEKDLQCWSQEFEPVWKTAELALRLIRDSGSLRPKLAEKGTLQIDLNPELACQMARVVLPGDVGYYAEIAGGRHQITVRFLTVQPKGPPVQVQEDIPFQLAFCVL
ncbi:Cell division protein ZapD [Gammaproteobacteria bacterium]